VKLQLKGTGVWSLHESIGTLVTLTRLDLQGNNNKLTHLPNSLSKLTALRELNLSECTSLRQLPNMFSQLRQLQELDITD
jgi:Leucine-rich repeat (LRR) protein